MENRKEILDMLEKPAGAVLWLLEDLRDLDRRILDALIAKWCWGQTKPGWEWDWVKDCPGHSTDGREMAKLMLKYEFKVQKLNDGWCAEMINCDIHAYGKDPCEAVARTALLIALAVAMEDGDDG